MKKLIVFSLISIFGFGAFAKQKLVDSASVNFVLADSKKASELLSVEDDFTDRLSDFDMSSRLHTSRKISKSEYIDFISKQTLDWTESETKLMNQVFDEIKSRMKDYKINLPETIYFVKTTGLDEGNSAYCRNQNVIVTSKNMITDDLNSLLTLYVHELFHIYSKNNLKIREKLYNQIGFFKTADLALPSDIAPHKITNPDSVNNNYYFDAVINGQSKKVMPLLLSASDYDEQRGGEFFEYLQLVFFAVDANKKKCTLTKSDGNYETYSYEQISNFFEKVGMNTGYIIHAEEILADNFELMINKSPAVQSPKIIDDMKKLLKK